MKEYTLTYTVDITDIIRKDGVINNELPEYFTNPKDVAHWIKKILEVDDVHVRPNIKVFERDV